MSEVLTELVAKITTDASGLSKGLADAEGKTEQSSKRMADSLKKVGMAMAASGAAITAALGFMGKAAIDEEINIKRLAISLQNVGVNYDDVKDSLEGVISATQRKTGIADNEQRDALNELITVTGSYDTALTWLQASLDMAAAKQMDTTSAARLLGRAAIGSTEMLTRYGIIIDEDATAAEILTEVQNKFGGAAEATANPLKVLSATMGDVAETIGANLIPLIKNVIGKIVDIAEKVQVWVKANPELAKTITILAGAIGITLTVLGGLIALYPILIGFQAAWNAVMIANPIGLIIIAVMALVTAGVLLWQNWDKVSHFFSDLWSNMKNAVLHSVDAMLGYLEKFLGWIPGIGDKIRSARDAIANMIDANKVSRDAKDVERSAKEMTGVIKAELEKQKSDALSALANKKKIAQEGFNTAVKAIKEEYGEYKTATKNKMDLAQDASDAERRALEDGLKQAKHIHNEKISLLEKEYNQRIRTLNAEADFEISQIQKQIDAIDKQTQAEDLATTRANEKNRLDELKAAMDSAVTAEDKAQTKSEYEEYAAEVARNELLRTRENEKDTLREQIEDIRNRTQTQVDNLNQELEAHKTTLNAEFEAFEETQNKIIAGLDLALETELKRLEIEKQGKLTLEQTKLDATLKTLTKEEESITASFAARLTEAAVYQVALEATLRDVEQTVTTHYISTRSSDENISGIETRSHARGFASGGIVPGTIGQPQLAIVHGGETVIPANESMGGVTVNLSGAYFFEREDQMNQFVDKISKTLDRKYRLGGRSLA